MDENIEKSEGQEAPEEQPKSESQPEPQPESQSEPTVCACGTGVEVSTNSRNLGMLSHLLGVFTGFVGTLIIWLLKKDEDEFIEANAKEALNFQISVCICAAALLVTIFFSFLILPLFVVDFVFCVIGAVKASNGQKYRYPISIRLIK